MKQETMLEYVVRKLNDGAYKQSTIAARSGLRPNTLLDIAKGTIKDPAASTVQKLYDVFKSLAD